MASQSNDQPGNSADGQRKVVIVTGGASGIGLAMVRHFAAEGHLVAIFDINLDSGEDVTRMVATEYPQAQLSFKKCDVSSWEDQAAAFKAVFEENGRRLDVVMANAGISEQGATTAVDLLEDEPTKPRLKALDVNLMGTVYSIKLAVHYMNKKPLTDAPSRGSIICTASNAGLYGFPTAPLYAASKAGVIGLVRSLGQHLERQKIQINSLAPAVLETNIAPDKALFKNMIITPMTTLTRGVAQILSDPSITGGVAEIHGDKITFRAQHEFVDDDTKKNLDTFWRLGYA